MKKKETNDSVTRSLFSIKNYLGFFFFISFVVSCSILLFYGSSGIPKERIFSSAPRTFINVVFLSLLACLLDGIHKKITVERPMKKILKATDNITQGDFSVSIQSDKRSGNKNEFDVVIDNINKMTKELSGIETLRTDFLANVSHELKTPLSVLQNYATLIQDPSLTEEKRLEYAKTITLSTNRLSDLITNILKLNKIENQQLYPNAKKYDLGEQLRECLLTFEDIWEEKELTLAVDIEENVTIKADVELLSLVWNNLFSNAIKYTDPKGAIKVSLTSDEQYTIVKVEDTGCGISPEVGRHIFDKFYQGDTSHAMQGNGLGLALVKRVIDIIGGEIFVHSALGEGSLFTVKFKKDKNQT